MEYPEEGEEPEKGYLIRLLIALGWVSQARVAHSPPAGLTWSLHCTGEIEGKR